MSGGPVDVPVERAIVMSLSPGVARALPPDVAAIPALTVTSAPGQAGPVAVVDGAIRYVGPPPPHPLVVRVVISSATQRDVDVQAVLAVGGAVFTGAVDGAANDPANWDSSVGDPLGEPWVFVPETPTATFTSPLPIAAAPHTRDVLIDRGATLITDYLLVADARLECQGTLAPHDIVETQVVVTRGQVAGRFPDRLRLAGGSSITEPVTVPYLQLDSGTNDPAYYAIAPTGTLTVERDAEVGFHANVSLAGRLLVNGDLHVTGELHTVAPSALAWTTRLDSTSARIAHDAGTIVVDQYASLNALTTTTVTAGARFNARGDLVVGGTFRNAGEVSVGHELRIEAGELTNTGAISYASCTQGPSAPPCP